jgi:hypothetical protein
MIVIITRVYLLEFLGYYIILILYTRIYILLTLFHLHLIYRPSIIHIFIFVFFIPNKRLNILPSILFNHYLISSSDSKQFSSPTELIIRLFTSYYQLAFLIIETLLLLLIILKLNIKSFLITIPPRFKLIIKHRHRFLSLLIIRSRRSSILIQRRIIFLLIIRLNSRPFLLKELNSRFHLFLLFLLQLQLIRNQVQFLIF